MRGQAINEEGQVNQRARQRAVRVFYGLVVFHGLEDEFGKGQIKESRPKSFRERIATKVAPTNVGKYFIPRPPVFSVFPGAEGGTLRYMTLSRGPRPRAIPRPGPGRRRCPPPVP